MKLEGNEKSFDESMCGEAKISAFEKASAVFRENPASVLTCPHTVSLQDADGTQCVYRLNTGRHYSEIVIDKNFDDISACCSLEERLGMGTDDDGILLPFSESAFSTLRIVKFGALDFYQILPETCSTGCPLVVEIPGNGGYPWLMARYSCANCRPHLGVAIISPVIGPDEDTELSWVESVFVPSVRSYLTQHLALVDKARVYLVTASRGNEIGLTAALAFPDIWSFLLTTGKFKFTAAMWDLVHTPGVFHKSKVVGLEKIEFHIGDEDSILTDAEFYTNFSVLLDRAAMTEAVATKLAVHIYPGQEHDTGFGVWTKRGPVIWEGLAAP